MPSIYLLQQKTLDYYREIGTQDEWVPVGYTEDHAVACELYRSATMGNLREFIKLARISLDMIPKM